MLLDIIPYQAIGPLKFGMRRDEVRRNLDSSYREFMRSSQQVCPSDFFEELSIFVEYDNDASCVAVEVAESENSAPLLQQRTLLGHPYHEIRDWLRSLDPDLSEDGSGCISLQLGVGLYADGVNKDAALPVEGVIVFAEGYYERATP